MPLKKALQQRDNPPPREQEEMAAGAERPLPEPAAAGPVAAGRPHRDYVEREAERYRREAEHAGSPGQPGPVPALDMTRALMAVNAMQGHFADRGWITPPYSRLRDCPNFVEALIQLASDADWLAREVPLPDHPAPHHPPVYYTIDEKTERPVPRADSLIRGDYVYKYSDGNRITQAEYICPWMDTNIMPPTKYDLIARGWDACYTLYFERENIVNIVFHWIERIGDFPILFRLSLRTMHFSPFPRPPILRRNTGLVSRVLGVVTKCAQRVSDDDDWDRD